MPAADFSKKSSPARRTVENPLDAGALRGNTRGMAKIDDQERERYRRQLMLPGWGEAAQEKLRKAVVFIAGAGGLGSPAALYLAAAGVGHLRICDSEQVELSNLNRQLLYGNDDLGRPKVDAAGRALDRLNQRVHVTPLRARIDDGSIAALAGDAVLLMDCLDNFETRFVLNRYAVKHRLPLVHAGVSGLGGQITFIHPPRTACLACLVPEAPAAGVFPILGAAAGVLGTLQALEALKYLTCSGSLLENRLLFFDGERLDFQEVALERDPSCRVCATPERGAGATPEPRRTDAPPH
jgi:molybdopterin/thiamine biosynthesis adenylyltransferase